MDFKSLLNSSSDVVLGWLLFKMNLNWESPPWNFENWNSSKKFAEFFSIHGSRRNYYANISPTLSYFL